MRRSVAGSMFSLASSGGESQLALLDELDAALGLGGELGDLGGIIGGRGNLGGDGNGSGSHDAGDGVAGPADQVSSAAKARIWTEAERRNLRS